ncbi:anaphase promoting complex subunit 11 [Cladophialophora carrionii]|uniref:Anaphase promoting complex subunit 11 n=1 Tax=Cladophialophora carrionii TaxID=86049 RepID=A0A1C1CDY0_9EURO|nr:anaphase promoting complex subunit 11 [Cladophialophora carrionii]
MSQQPRQVPSHSSSPSKSSSRRTTSGGGGTSTRPISQPPQQQPSSTTAPRSLLPSPHFEDDPIVASHQQYSKRPNLTLNDPEYSEHAVAESEHCSHGLGSAHPQPAESIPSFQPFFTLIEDSVTTEHYHPTVHYIFADDDTDMITEAALRSLEVLDPSQRAVGTHGQSQTQGHDADHGDSLNASRLPPPVAGMREHYIVLDVQSQAQPPPSAQQEDNSGTAASAFTYEVSSAHSLSAEWQVLRTSISTAPTIGDNPSAEDEGLMLRIEGRGNTPGNIMGNERGKGKDADAEKEKEKETLEEMIERFQRRLEDVRMVIEAGGGTSGLNIGDGAGGED